MSERFYAELPGRGVLEVAGADRVAFLQGLVSNDVAKVSAERAIFAALLTAQGRYLFDFFILGAGDTLVLETEAARIADLQRRLGLYKLRSKVAITDASSRFAVAVGFGDEALPALGLASPGAAEAFAGGMAFADPRLAQLGARLILPRGGNAYVVLEGAGFAPADAERYDRYRLALGVPDGSRDLGVEKALLLESGFDELNGIDWQKGCYMGQELTARMKYRALVKKRLLPVELDGPLPAPGTPILLNGAEAGEVHSGRDRLALALLRLDSLAAAESGAKLLAGGTRLTPSRPAWVRI